VSTTEPDKPDPITLYRQMHCSHAFIKGVADATKQCGKCGVTWAAWEAMQAAKPHYSVLGNHSP